MTEILFHFNVSDRLGYVCRLLRKAVQADAQVLVAGSAEVLGALDERLWAAAPTAFLAHCHAKADPSVLEASPIVLAERADDAAALTQVLLNLEACVPEGFGRFERLIEVVTQDPLDRQAARLRWKHYADRGYAIRRHEAAPLMGV